MVPRRLVVLAVSALVLALVATASATQQTVSGRLTITGSGTNWTLTFANAGTATGPVRCWRYTFPPGVNALGIAQPPGDWQVGGNKPPPAPILGGRSTTGIPPGGTAAFGVRTDTALNTSGPTGTAAISEDCVGDFPAPVEFGPQPAPPPPCRCQSLDTNLSIIGMHSGEQQPLFIDLRIEWKLRCTGGAGTCHATFDARPASHDARRGLRLGTPPKKQKATNVECKGRCARTTAGSLRAFLQSTKANYGPDRLGTRAVPSVELEIEQVCGAKRRTRTFEIVFKRLDEKVRIDRKKSDLNGNAVPDGDEKGR